MTRRQLLVRAVLGVVLLVLARIDGDLFSLVAAVALVAAPAANLAVLLLLQAAVRELPNPPASLRSRAGDAADLWLASSIGGVLGLNRLFELQLPTDFVLGILAFALLLISAPALDWLLLWRSAWLPPLRRALGGDDHRAPNGEGPPAA